MEGGLYMSYQSKRRRIIEGEPQSNLWRGVETVEGIIMYVT